MEAAAANNAVNADMTGSPKIEHDRATHESSDMKSGDTEIADNLASTASITNHELQDVEEIGANDLDGANAVNNVEVMARNDRCGQSTAVHDEVTCKSMMNIQSAERSQQTDMEVFLRDTQHFLQNAPMVLSNSAHAYWESSTDDKQGNPCSNLIRSKDQDVKPSDKHDVLPSAQAALMTYDEGLLTIGDDSDAETIQLDA